MDKADAPSTAEINNQLGFADGDESAPRQAPSPL